MSDTDAIRRTGLAALDDAIKDLPKDKTAKVAKRFENQNTYDELKTLLSNFMLQEGDYLSLVGDAHARMAD